MHLAEHYFGATQNCAASIFLRIHHYTGASVIIGGEILLNNSYNLGEIGHIQIDPLGERYHCGNFGCLETIVANSTIENRIRQQLEQNYPSQLKANNCSIKAIYSAENKNNPLAIEVIKHVGHHLGKAIAIIIINLFNPPKVVIDGEITAAEKVLYPPCKTASKHKH
ncbi:MAG: ROK family protein [Candidatus Phlomobacter fragariae]